MMNQRRSNVAIIADMLRLGGNGNGAGKTEIMYGANMSYYQLKKYLNFLLSQGFIDSLARENSHMTYHVTEKGQELLGSIDKVMEILELKGLD